MIDVDALAYASNFPPEDLSHWGDLVSIGSGFTRISIPQKRRRPRQVLMPSVGLDRLLKQLSGGLARVTGYMPPKEVHGFIRGRSIATNAREHLGQDVVLRVDLKDFFGTIDGARLNRALQANQIDSRCANAIAGVTLVEGGLAQGFSTSPLLSNITFLETDRALAAAVQCEGVQYTRYVDDLTFSGDRSLVHDEFLEAIEAILDRHGWLVNKQKTRFMRRGKPQFVTGLYVGDSAGPHIPRSMKRLLRREVYFASRFGLEDSRLQSPTPIDADRLGGWVHYAAYVEPVFGDQIRSLWSQVDSRHTGQQIRPDWDLILDEIDFPDNW